MNQVHPFQSRIDFQENITPILEKVCADYNFGLHKKHSVIPVGYEDFNLILETTGDKYFVKVFADFRNEDGCQRYVDIMQKVIEAGVKHPGLYKSQQGYLYKTEYHGKTIRLCVLQFIDGVTFYEKNLKATEQEMRFLVRQAALINSLNIKPRPVYDSWAIVNFLEEYKKKNQYLEQNDKKFFLPLVEEFSKLNIEKLPHSFVHGDIINTNVIKDNDGRLYIIDFSVANYYPRIQELAVLLCNMLFDENRPQEFLNHYKFALDEYQKTIKLTSGEILSLPIFVRAAHAMHVLSATYEKKAKDNLTLENKYWIKLGRAGLEATVNL